MVSTLTESPISQFEIRRTELIAAPTTIVFEAILAQLSSENEPMPGKPMPMQLEAWPGGRWFRDLGNNSGHFWGHVQVIKPPTLLELCGPMFMSYPVSSHIQYRLTAEGNSTQLSFWHRAFGMIEKDHREGVQQGWSHYFERIREVAEKRAQNA